MKIALVHDYLKENGGAERVLLALHEIWPEAPVYTIYCKNNSAAGKAFKNAKIIESWFAKLPFSDKLISPLRFLIPLIWRGFDFKDYDLVISSASWAITKGFAEGKTKEICYCHTPPRYLYGYETSKNWKKNFFLRVYASLINHFMRLYDFKRAQKVTLFVANSREVQKRIKKFYRRESEVINPPVDLPSFNNKSTSKKDFFLTGGRLELPKNFDLIIKACNELGLSLKVFGKGTSEEYLRSLAGKNIEFLGTVTDEEKFKLLSECKTFIVAAADEDFGITPVEAMAAGTPVIAYKGGGYLESVVEGKTGTFFEDINKESLKKALASFDEKKYKKEDCRNQAEKFSKEKFKEKIKKTVENA
ncbi:glycosyltransferase family 4 protein [Candidatus Microgenomates bacterium]|jgi:glycosyltransferase involved in cell wall biosynthesis|nr:MAG: glycosyltransferase family 4 protein [Candidatus Microgenomates bacterium]